METALIVLVGAAALAVAAAIAWAAMRSTREAAVPRDGGPRAHPLTPADRARFADVWHATEVWFVENPAGAVVQADLLVGEVLRARGYPVSDIEHGLRDLTAGHPGILRSYREAHEVAVAARHGAAKSEDLRRATIRYRAVLEDLLEAA